MRLFCRQCIAMRLIRANESDAICRKLLRLLVYGPFVRTITYKCYIKACPFMRWRILEIGRHSIFKSHDEKVFILRVAGSFSKLHHFFGVFQQWNGIHPKFDLSKIVVNSAHLINFTRSNSLMYNPDQTFKKDASQVSTLNESKIRHSALEQRTVKK